MISIADDLGISCSKMDMKHVSNSAVGKAGGNVWTLTNVRCQGTTHRDKRFSVFERKLRCRSLAKVIVVAAVPSLARSSDQDLPHEIKEQISLRASLDVHSSTMLLSDFAGSSFRGISE